MTKPQAQVRKIQVSPFAKDRSAAVRSPASGPTQDTAHFGSWKFSALVCLLIIFMPLFSAVRGVSEPVGRGLMAFTDLCMVALFAWALFKPGLRTLKFLILGLIALSVFNIALWTHDVTLAATYQGFRKSMLWLLAICIGYSVRRRDRTIVMWAIISACALVALYAVKQWLFGYSAFDFRMLDVQSSGEYTNIIGGRRRAISFLSSGFHVGMTGGLLVLAAMTLKSKRRFYNLAIALVIAALGIVAIYSSYTRTFMVVAAALACLQLSRTTRHPLLRVGLITAAGCVIVGGFTLGYFSAIEGAVFSDNRFTSRSISYETMAAHFSAYPWGALFGFGLGSAGSTLGGSFLPVNAVWVEPHNTLLKYVVEFGAPLSLWLFWEIAKVVRAARPDPALRFDNSLSMLGIFLLIGAGLTITSVETWPVSLYIGFIIGMFAIPPTRAAWRGTL